jgi:WD40 repeat protein
VLKHLLWIALVVTGCAPVLPPTPPPVNERIPPTLPAPPWIESAAPVTLDNVASISLLGRLDQPGTPSTVFAYALSPDSTRLAGLNNEQLLMWDLVNGTLVFSAARGDANQVFFSPDKTEVYTIDPSGMVNVYDAESGVSQNNFQGMRTFNGTLAYDPFAGWLALGGIDGEVKVWDALERRSLATIAANTLQIAALAFSPDGEQLASGGDDGRVGVWNWRDRARAVDIAIPGTEKRPARVTFSPDSAQLAIGTNDMITLWSLPEGELLHELPIPVGGVTALMTYSPDGRYLAAAGQNNELTLWEAETGLVVVALPGVQGERLSAGFSPNAAMMLTSALDGPVSLWNMEQITDQTVGRADLSVGSQRILFTDWTDDSRLLLFIDANGPIYVWGVATEGTEAP